MPTWKIKEVEDGLYTISNEIDMPGPQPYISSLSFTYMDSPVPKSTAERLKNEYDSSSPVKIEYGPKFIMLTNPTGDIEMKVLFTNGTSVTGTRYLSIKFPE